MELRQSRLRRFVSALLAACLLMAGSGAAAQEQAVPLVLVHRFAIAEPPSWGDVAVNLVPAEWRVGGPDGPLANAWQLRTALGSLVTVALNSTLRFQFRGIVNDLHPSKVDRASGVVILRALQRGRAS